MHNYLAISWSTSRGRDTYGYNICRLDDKKAKQRFRTCGGGYDMLGTVFGEWLENTYQEKLVELFRNTPLSDAGCSAPGYMKNKDYSGAVITPKGKVTLNGACGINCMIRIAEAAGIEVTQDYNKKGHTVGYFITD